MVPGCNQKRWLHVHHIVFWEDGGRTGSGNLCALCPRHHRMLHAGYQVQGDPNGRLRFYRPDGSYLASSYPAEARRPRG